MEKDTTASIEHLLKAGCYYTWLCPSGLAVLKPQRILELGNYHGASTIIIYSELTDETKAFYSVDLVRDITFVPNKILSDKKVKFTFGNDLNLSIYRRLTNTNRFSIHRHIA